MSNKCKKLGNHSTKAERAEAHRIELEMREMQRAHNAIHSRDRSFIFANLSKNHPDYGDTPSEHEARKNGS